MQRRLACDPDGPLLEFCDDGIVVSARDVHGEAQRTAHGMASLGAGRGDRIAILLPNCVEMCVTFFGALELGAICVPVNTAYKGAFLHHQLADSGARILVSAIDYGDSVREVVGDLPQLETIVFVGPGAGAPPVDGKRSLPWESLRASTPTRTGTAVTPSDLAALIYTAGTTGPSKGCMLSHNYVVDLARQVAHTWQRRPDDVVWTPLPLFHLNAWVIAVLGTLVAGGRAAISRRFSVSGFWATMNATGATIASLLGAPAIFIANADDDPEHGKNATLRLVAAAPMSPGVAAAYRDRFGVATFSAGYGLTEASLILSLPPGETNKPGAAGRSNDREFDVRVFDEADRELPRGEVGEIVVRPRRPHVMFDGYWRRPDATVDLSRNWWFHTGDLGRIDSDGFLFFVERKKDCLRRRGENISSFEMEATFLSHPGIAEVAVHAVPSDAGEDDVNVTAVLGAGVDVTEEDLCRWCMDRVPYFAVPRYIEFRDELPRNPVGRVLKYELREDGVTPQTWDREGTDIEVRRP